MGLRLHFPDELDAKVMHWFTARWNRMFWLDATMIVLAKWTPIVMLGVIVAASTGLFLPKSQHTHALSAGILAVISATLARAVNEPISRLANRPRPFETLGFRPLLTHDAGHAFPSNHATGAFALAMSFISLPGYFSILFCLAVLLSLSRIYNGLHHPTDVVAGALHGTAAAWLVIAVFHGV